MNNLSTDNINEQIDFLFLKQIFLTIAFIIFTTLSNLYYKPI